MKKIIATVILTLVLTLGMGVTVFAAENASVVSAADSGGNPVTVTFTAEAENSFSLEFTNKFGELGEADRKSLAAYYGCDEYGISMGPYGGGNLDLTGTGVSAENPVTITFSVSGERDIPKAGYAWLYVIQRLEDGTYKLIHAESSADGTITAQFTESGQIVFNHFDLARESFPYEEVTVVEGVQSAVDAQGNPVTVSVTPLDEDRKMVAAGKGLELFGIEPIVTADVHLENSNVSEANPITVTFLIAGINEGDTISVLHKKADGSWETLLGTTGNGTVTVTFTSLSPVAFVRTAAVAPVTASVPAAVPETTPAATENSGETTNAAASTIVSPKTGDDGVYGFGILAAAVCIVAFVYIIRKKNV